MKDKKILVLGGTGMIGHTLFSYLSSHGNFDVYSTVRNSADLSILFSSEIREKIIVNVDANIFNTVIKAFAYIHPDIVINCIGISKQLPLANDPLPAITINSQFPHKLSLLCGASGARMIHLSTDCVFNGIKGNYSDKEPSDAKDIYGRTKYLGEVEGPNSVTLRKSVIGHELMSKHGLIEWFLSQEKEVRGYTNAIYSGFPTIELARIISDYVIPNQELKGVYNVSADPISKYDLLKLVAQKYKKDIRIEPYHDFYLDRSLDSTLFRRITGYLPPTWSTMVDQMYQDYISSPHYREQRGVCVDTK